jgi:peptidoglycan-associated lipoprotein
MKKVLLSVVLGAVLSACSTTSDKAANIANAPTAESLVSSPGMLDGRAGTAMDPLIDPNHILSQRSIYFDFDSFVVNPEYRDMLSAHAKYLSTHQNANIVIQGNTDNRGTAEYNLSLGQKRAEAVKKTMNLMGVSDAQIETVSFGKERPKELGQGEDAWAKNRRADIVYAGETQ